MMFLTVILNSLAITTAIRVPTIWPEQEKRIADLQVAQNSYNSGIRRNNFGYYISSPGEADLLQANNQRFYTPKLEQQTTDVAYATPFAQNKRRPSGSHTVLAAVNGKTKQGSKENYNVHEPDVSYTVPHSLNNKRTPTVLHVNVAVKNNRDNKGDYNRNIKHNQPSTNTRHNNPKNAAFSQPVVYVNQNTEFPATADGWTPITGQYNPHDAQVPNNIYVHRSPNHISNKIPNRRYSQSTNPRRQYKNINDRADSSSDAVYHPDSLRHRVLNKNYRDDKTHEPSNNEDAAEIQESEDEVENDEVEKIPAGTYEAHKDVPTRPIYPGEGQWAIRGLKHRPFISKHNYTNLEEDSDNRPEGYGTFEKAVPAFEKQHSKFNANLQEIPQKHFGPGEYIQDKNEESESQDHEEQKEDVEEDHEVDEDENDGFVPTRLLAQVRKTEDEEHLPSDPSEGRLREVIKDSKIHTVYTEEGYEDVGYDHAGHEKKAEEGEGQAEFDKDALKQKRKYPKSKNIGFDEVDVLKEFENYDDPHRDEAKDKTQATADFETSASSYEDPDHNKNMKMNNFATVKENKTTEVKNMDDGETELEITSEIKIMTQPNNVSTAHKFVKIVPKNKNIVNLKQTVVKRRKRFVNDFPKVEIHKDFLDILNEEKIKQLPIASTEKYPYYKIRNSEILNKNSPLRYAEDLKNIPQKIPGRMTFYEQTGASECPEIPRNVNPIPDRIEKLENKAKHGESPKGNGGFAGLPDVPRLKNLGDKIDCLKAKYFGENPLDSPIFHEDAVAPPEPIFKELTSMSNLAKINNPGNAEEIKQVEDLLLDSLNVKEKLDEDAALPGVFSTQSAETSENQQFQEEDRQPDETFSASDVKEDYGKSSADYETLEQQAFPQTTQKPSLAYHPAVGLSTTVLSNIHEKLATTTELPKITQTTEASTVSTLLRNLDLKHVLLTQQLAAQANFMPRHIYDQIDFAENLGNVNLEQTVNQNSPLKELHTTEAANIDKNLSRNNTENSFGNETENLNSNATTNEKSANSASNEIDDQTLTLINGLMESSEEVLETVDERQPKSLSLAIAINSQDETVEKQSNSSNLLSVTNKRMDPDELLPESAALRILRKRRKRPQRPFMHIFDVNRFLPTPLPPIITFPTTNTVLPKYKTLSEVYYKDEIQPNEQLNVFADVINNIKNSPGETLIAQGSENFRAVENNNSQKNSVRKVKVPARKIRIKHSDTTNHRGTPSTTTTTTTTASPIPRRKNKYKNHKPDAQIYEEYLATIKENEGNFGARYKEPIEISQSTKTRHTTQKRKPSLTNIFEDSYISEDTSYSKPIINEDLATGTVVDEVLGLAAPPFILDYSSFYNTLNKQTPSLVYDLTEQTPLNKFLVPGMKPPGNHKPLLYSDFKLLQHNRLRRTNNNYHRIRKRSPYKPSYSEIRRPRPQAPAEEEEKEKEEQEEDDDYVPQRNRNFRYDVENDRVIYMKKQEEEEPEPEPETQIEVEEEEEGGDYLTLERVEPPKPFVVITTERNGPSFLEFVQQLKNNSGYKIINDPTTTEKPSEETKTKSDSKNSGSTTTKQVAQGPVPEFLNVIALLKSSDSYKDIKEPKEKSKSKSTTAAPPEEEEVDEEVEEETEEPEIVNIRNSPGGNRRLGVYDKMQIFDITEYLPKPRTVIDYSKYKTIERTPVPRRHNISSRYNSEDDELPLRSDDSTQVPVSAASDRNEDNIQYENGKNYVSYTRRSGYSASEEAVEEEVRTTTTTTTTTTEAPEITTTQSRRLRLRSRKRPTTTTTTPRPTTTVSITKRRRRPTTTAEPALEENYSQTQRVIRRKLPIERFSRQSQKIPPNHKAFYTPIVVEDDPDNDSKRPVVHRKRKVSRLVTPEKTQLPVNSNRSNHENLGKPGEIQPRKLVDVQVFKKYDQNKRHGGNYRRADGIKNPQVAETNSVPPTAYEIEDSKEIRLSDVVPKPFAFYSDPTLPKSVNLLTEPKAPKIVPVESEESEAPGIQERNDKDYQEDYTDEVKINFNKHSETATKTPVYIVKDPSKRLYFYAPVK